MKRSSGAIAGAVLLALMVSGCAGDSAHVKSAGAAVKPVPPSDTDAAFTLLMQGDEAGARKRLQLVTRREPTNVIARLLTESIDRDPKDLLGPQSYPYVAREGDTIVGLAERFLGNRLKAYQLLRYNGFKAPVTLAPGQIVRIPGEPAPPPEAPRPARLAPATPAPAPKPKPVPPKPAAPVVNPAAARQARAAGLAALNQGNVARAVALLQRAKALDPVNPLVARDLARAERIAATVKARR